MSVEIDPREVLEHLEYLGYTSITKEQLKDFIRDLKKLIKYEQYREKRVQTLGEDLQNKVSVACETSSPFKSSSSKYDPHKSSLTNLEDFTNQLQNSRQPRPEIVSPNLQKSYHLEDYDEQSKPHDHDCLACCKQCHGKNELKTGVRKDFCDSDKNPCPSFIRPGIGKPSKCDPVALYHYYQNQWSKRPLPGEDPRTDLRWAVRTRLAQQKQQQQQAFLRKTTSVDRVHHNKVHT